MHDIPKHIRQSKIATRMSIRQSFVIQPQGVQHCGVQVVHVHRIFSRSVTEIICRAIRQATSNASACHPQAEAVRMMVPAGLAP